MTPLKLNLGCAKDIKDGYVNIDAFPFDDRVVKMDITNLDYPDNSVDEIYAKDVIEHIPFFVSLNCIQKWYKCLKPDGRLYIQTTNFTKIMDAFNCGVWNIAHLNYMLFSGVNWIGANSQEYDFHKSVYTKDFLLHQLNKFGYKIISIEEDQIDDALKTNPTSHNLNVKIWACK